MAKFVLEIEMGREAMRTSDHLWDVLTSKERDSVATRLILGESSGYIRDADGNQVGHFRIDGVEELV